jgi:hypothetical protein
MSRAATWIDAARDAILAITIVAIVYIINRYGRKDGGGR